MSAWISVNMYIQYLNEWKKIVQIEVVWHIQICNIRIWSRLKLNSRNYVNDNEKLQLNREKHSIQMKWLRWLSLRLSCHSIFRKTKKYYSRSDITRNGIQHSSSEDVMGAVDTRVMNISLKQLLRIFNQVTSLIYLPMFRSLIIFATIYPVLFYSTLLLHEFSWKYWLDFSDIFFQ